MTVIEFENVSFDYDKTLVLKEVSFKVEQGEFIGVIGPNGGGKTTALKLMMGFLKPKCGKILTLNTSPKMARAQMGYVPQINHYDKQFAISVLEVVLTGGVSKVRWFGTIPKKEKLRAEELLETLGVGDLKERPFGSLSGGQAQKVLIARALMSDPDLLLLDEPTANIDPQSEASIFSFLNTLKKEKTILIVMHNFDAIVKHTERVLCFQHEVSTLKPEEVCEHFSIGMYHSTEDHTHG